MEFRFSSTTRQRLDFSAEAYLDGRDKARCRRRLPNTVPTGVALRSVIGEDRNVWETLKDCQFVLDGATSYAHYAHPFSLARRRSDCGWCHGLLQSEHR